MKPPETSVTSGWDSRCTQQAARSCPHHYVDLIVYSWTPTPRKAIYMPAPGASFLNTVLQVVASHPSPSVLASENLQRVSKPSQILTCEHLQNHLQLFFGSYLTHRPLPSPKSVASTRKSTSKSFKKLVRRLMWCLALSRKERSRFQRVELLL